MTSKRLQKTAAAATTVAEGYRECRGDVLPSFALCGIRAPGGTPMPVPMTEYPLASVVACTSKDWHSYGTMGFTGEVENLLR
jgi:hypothetical protein